MEISSVKAESECVGIRSRTHLQPASEIHIVLLPFIAVGMYPESIGCILAIQTVANDCQLLLYTYFISHGHPT